MGREAGKKLCLMLAAAIIAAMLSREGGIASEPLIPLEGPAVLIVHQDTETDNLPRSQQDIIHGHEWPDHVPAGNWRVLDVDTVFKAPSPFEAPFERPRQSLPWLIVSGKRNHEGPLPKTVADVIEKIEAAK